MRNFVLILFCLVAVSSAEFLPENAPISVFGELLKLKSQINQLDQAQSRIAVNINDYLDKAMKSIQLWVVKNGLDPVEVPDMKEGFSVKLGLIKFHGELELTRGWTQGLSTVERSGDATLSYEAKFLRIRLPLYFKSLLINYDYCAQIMNLGPKGGIEGKVKNLKLLVDLSVDMKTLELELQEFKIPNAGKISIKFSGNPLVDWLTNALTGVATTLLHNVVIKVVQNQVREVIVKAINEINNKLHSSANVH